MPEPTQDELIARIAVKLAGLGVRAEFLRIEDGPVVRTMYYRLGFETPISKIINRSEDIAIACGVESVLIYRKGGEIAIEIPKIDRQIIGFDSCLYQLFKSKQLEELKLPLMLGVDANGSSFNLDLVEQPHVLIAGSTGGGKSVLLSSLIGSLAIARSPKQVKFILVDTKRLDLPLFQNLPNVVDNVETAEEFQRVMDKLMSLVRKRTELIRGVARNITEYNMLAPTGNQLPYYVMFIDELADLIDDDKVRSLVDENYAGAYPRVPFRIKQLVQICRAAGIHIIAATQRSSVKVINGDIKSNFPTRIALRLPTRADSTTILSGGGAENLLGKGDMLVESPTWATPKRAHGAFVSNADIARILSEADSIRQTLASIAH